jgi:hypothetical protein
MATKDHDVLGKKKLPASGRSAAAPKLKAPVPEMGAKLQQGTTADMQANVGNSGLKDLLAEQKPRAAAKEPSRMGPDELRAQAKADAEALAGKEKAKAGGSVRAKAGAELDEKQKAILESEAARKKKEAETARQKKEAVQAAQTRDADADRAAAARPAAKAGRADKSAPGKKAAKGAPEAEAPAVAPRKRVDTKEAARKGAAGVARKAAAEKRVVAREAEAEHARTKVEAGRSLVGKGKGEGTEHAKAARAKVIDTGKRAAGSLQKAAEADQRVAETEKKVNEKAPEARGAGARGAAEKPAAGKESKVAAGPATKDTGGKPGATGARQEEPKNARAEAHEQAKKKGATEREEAERQAAAVKERKADVEQKLGAESDVGKKAALGRDAEVAAAAEKAADDKVKKREEAEDAVQAAKDRDVTIETVSRAADLEAHDGQQVTLVGIYVPRPAEAGGPQLGHVSVMIGDQEVRLGTEVRGTAEVLRLSGEKVVVTGKLDLKRQAGQPLEAAKREKPVLTGFRAPHRR